MNAWKLASYLYLVVALIAACTPQSPIPKDPDQSLGNLVGGYAELVEALIATGATVTPVSELHQPFFKVTGKIININGIDVQTFEYPDESTRIAESSQIAKDGSFATTMITWVDQPNFYASGRMIVLYVGQDTALKSLLSQVMGTAIAEGEIPARITDPASGNPGLFPARFRECIAREPEIQRPLRLAYVSDGDIWIWDEGLEPISLTDSGDIREALLTPKGEVVVFTRGALNGTFTLWAISADGSALHSMTPGTTLTGSVEMLSFSGDETQLAFTHRLTDKAGELWVAALNGSGAKRLVSQEDLMMIVAEPQAVGALPAGVTWIPNSPVLTYAAYPTFAEEGIYIYVQDRVWYVSTIDGVKAERFGPGTGGRVAYSPDGTMMILTTPDSLRLMNIEAGDIHPLGVAYTQIGFGEYYGEPPLIWTADSQALLMVLLKEGQDAFDQETSVTLWRVPVDGSPGETLLEAKGFFPTFTFSPQGEKVSYWRSTEPQFNHRELHFLELDGSEHIVYDSGEQLEFYGWSPDGQHFIYGYWESRQAFVGDLCGEPIPMNVFPVNPRWIDASRFIFEHQDEGQGRLEVYLGALNGNSVLKLNLEPGSWYDYRLLRAD